MVGLCSAFALSERRRIYCVGKYACGLLLNDSINSLLSPKRLILLESCRRVLRVGDSLALVCCVGYDLRSSGVVV